MIRKAGYKHAYTETPIEFWEMRNYSGGFTEQMTLPDGRKTDIPNDVLLTTHTIPPGTVIQTVPFFQVVWGGYVVAPKESTMPQTFHSERFPAEVAVEIQAAIDAGERIERIVDRLAIEHLAHFKGGTIEE